MAEAPLHQALCCSARFTQDMTREKPSMGSEDSRQPLTSPPPTHLWTRWGRYLVGGGFPGHPASRCHLPVPPPALAAHTLHSSTGPTLALHTLWWPQYEKAATSQKGN